jgi:hypothetical protein
VEILRVISGLTTTGVAAYDVKWISCIATLPAFTPLLTFSLRVTVWLWFVAIAPALTFVLILILLISLYLAELLSFTLICVIK